MKNISTWYKLIVSVSRYLGLLHVSSLAYIMTSLLLFCECIACAVSVSLLRLAHAAQEMPEWERWGNNWSRKRREKPSRASVSMCLFWQYPPCVRACLPRSLRNHPHKDLDTLPFQRSALGKPNFSSLCEECSTGLEAEGLGCTSAKLVKTQRAEESCVCASSWIEP